jgi:hypothetical protein
VYEFFSFFFTSPVTPNALANSLNASLALGLATTDQAKPEIRSTLRSFMALYSTYEYIASFAPSTVFAMERLSPD